MTLLSIVQDCADDIGLPRPSSLVGAVDISARRFLIAAKRTGEHLYRRHNWSILHREHSFETEADEPNYAVPEDFGRPMQMVAWDRAQFWRMRGNRSPGEWQRLKSSLIASPGLRRSYRLLVGPLAGSILIDPTPSSVAELVIEYVSSFWSETAAGAGQATLGADDDEFRLDHELVALGIAWRAKKSNGLAYADDRP